CSSGESEGQSIPSVMQVSRRRDPPWELMTYSPPPPQAPSWKMISKPGSDGVVVPLQPAVIATTAEAAMSAQVGERRISRKPEGVWRSQEVREVTIISAPYGN